MDNKTVIKEAILTGEIIKIRYFGGSQPGSIREIAPISLKGNKVLAMCFSSGEVKSFLLEKIEFGISSNDEKYWEKGHVQVVKYENLNQLLIQNNVLLGELGWHIESKLAGVEQSITLHKYFKNGKPKKYCDVSVMYEKYTYDMVLDLDAGTDITEAVPHNLREKKRPWSVSASTETGKHYGSLDKAAALFLEWAEKHAP